MERNEGRGKCKEKIISFVAHLFLLFCFYRRKRNSKENWCIVEAIDYHLMSIFLLNAGFLSPSGMRLRTTPLPSSYGFSTMK